ncbi:conserved hypothetical protein [Trichinella spiralis]|uniref:hypothetical protein n=1 Tax=Trichinella spiralis TaxID=6334 RepID=UPI0001EFD3CF|nr:conserved hypothetical protein [Trichinella spiralis]
MLCIRGAVGDEVRRKSLSTFNLLRCCVLSVMSAENPVLQSCSGTRDCLDIVSREKTCPLKDESEIKAWKKIDALARSIICRSVDDFHHAIIRSCKTSKEMMDCIVRIKKEATISSKLLVSSEFYAYTWKPGMHVASFIAGLNVIVNKIRLSVQKPASLSDLTSQLHACESDQLCRSMQAVSIGEALVGKKTTSKEPNGFSKKRNIECWNFGIGTIDVEVLNGKQWIVSVLNDVLYIPEFRSSCLFSIGAAAARGYKIMMDNFNTRLMMNNRTELVRYKDGDLYALLIRRSSDNTSMSAMFAEGEHTRSNFAIIELDTSVSIKIMMQYNLVDGLRATT